MNKAVLHFLQNRGFQVFKYLVYSFLAVNVYMFFQEEWLASKVIFVDGVTLESAFEAFASTIDTAAWLLLLLLFELETYILDDEKIVGLTKLLLHGIRVLCYTVILFSLYGYITKLGFLDQFQLSKIKELCSVAADWKFMSSMNIYNDISVKTCLTLAKDSHEFYTLDSLKVITSDSSLFKVKLLGWADVINATAWVTVVVMLEYEVRVQHGQFSGVFWSKYNIFVKAVVYGVLLIAAIFWGITGNFIEFWDAFLWIIAFVFIEMNMFEWQAETAEQEQE